MASMQLLQAFPGYMRIDLGGGDVGVAQQHLHHAQVGAMIEQMGGKGVAQRVRRQRLGESGGTGAPIEKIPKGLAGHSLAMTSDEYRIAGLSV